MNTGWHEKMEDLLREPVRSELVEHLLRGLKEQVDKEEFQNILERSEEVLDSLGESLFDEHTELDSEFVGVKDFGELVECLLDELADNFSAERLAEFRQALQLQEDIILQVRGANSQGERAERNGSNAAWNSDFGANVNPGMDSDLLGLLAGAGIGGLLGLKKGVLPAAGGALIGGLVGIAATVLLDTFGDDLA
ncbi:MAG: hypothetical protein AAF975_00965 [Spirochaetota bacterium]